MWNRCIDNKAVKCTETIVLNEMEPRETASSVFILCTIVSWCTPATIAHMRSRMDPHVFVGGHLLMASVANPDIEVTKILIDIAPEQMLPILTFIYQPDDSFSTPISLLRMTENKLATAFFAVHSEEMTKHGRDILDEVVCGIARHENGTRKLHELMQHFIETGRFNNVAEHLC